LGKIKAILFAASLISIPVFSQIESSQVPVMKNEIGIDLASVLTFLSRKSESYSFGYKSHITEWDVLRLGLNIDCGTAKDDMINIGSRLGYEYDYPIMDRHWGLYIGSDLSFYYSANNFQLNKTTRYGLTPLIGVNYFFTNCFSLSTEVGLNLFYSQYRNPDSFDPVDNSSAFNTNIGSVGMIVLTYHFNLKKGLKEK